MNAPARAFVETAHGRLAYRRAGEGPPVVLIHGSLVTADDMVLALMASLAERFDVVAFDRPGHGASAQTPGEAGSAYAQAAMLAAGWRALGLHNPVVVGHSFGGAVALSAALALPEAIAGVVALAPICFPEPRFEQMLLGWRAVPLAGEVLAATQGRVVDAVTLPLLRRAMFLPQVMPAAFAAEFPFEWASRPAMMVADAKDSVMAWRDLARSAMAYPACRTPVRFFGGTHDLVVRNATNGYAASLMMPEATFTWIEGAGHMLHHFHQPAIGDAVGGLAGLAGTAGAYAAICAAPSNAGRART